MQNILVLGIFFSSLAFIYCNICGPNEEINICGQVCEPSCQVRDFSNALCISCSQSTQGCRCKDNYFRDEQTKQCVDAEHCSTCAYGESKEMCGKKCEGTCAQPSTPAICSRIRCGSPLLCRCDLANNFVRNADGRCVKKNNCFKSHDHC